MTHNEQELRRAGLKVTLPRVRILELMERNLSARHMSAEDIYRALLEAGDDVGLATVYRVLTQFEAAGIVQRHHFEGGHSVFELKSDEHHDHILCTDCGRVLEFHDDIIEQRQHAIAESMGFALTEHSLHLYGICQRKDCDHRKK